MKKNAFTLLEMLVAVVLIALLIGVALFAFRLQLITIHKVKTAGLVSAIRYTEIKAALESVKYYVVNDYDMLNQPMRNLHYYFHGDSMAMKFITTNPIFSNVEALVEISCKEKELLYKEEPLYKNMNFLRPEFSENFHELILYSDLQDCHFGYFDDKNSQKNSYTNKIPKAMQISLQNRSGDISIFSLVRSDDNLTQARIYDALYPTQ